MEAEGHFSPTHSQKRRRSSSDSLKFMENTTTTNETSSQNQYQSAAGTNMTVSSLKTNRKVDFVESISSNLILFGNQTHVTFLQKSETPQGISWVGIGEEIHHKCRVTAATSKAVEPLEILTATSDHKIQLWQSSSKQFVNIGSHSDSINQVAYSKSLGYVASQISDDMSCKLWNPSESQMKLAKTIRLKSPGVAVGWNELQPSTVLIVEQNSTIGFWDIRQNFFTPVVSISVDSIPAVSADWSADFPVGIAAGTRWYIYDIRSTTRPYESAVGHHEGITAIRFSKVGRNLFATAGKFAIISIWDLAHPKLPFTKSQGFTRVDGCSWLFDSPCLVTGGGNQLYFHHILKL